LERRYARHAAPLSQLLSRRCFSETLERAFEPRLGRCFLTPVGGLITSGAQKDENAMPQLNHPKLVAADACDPHRIKERIQSIERALAENSLPVLVVEASSKCNLTCVFCGMHSKRLSTAANTAGRKQTLPKSHIPLELFSETIAKCRDLPKLKVLYLHGNGEPLLNPHIVKMVAIAKQADIAEQIVLVTNGVCLTKKMFQDLVAAGASSIRVSLDVVSPEKFKIIKGADRAGEVLANLDACIDLIKTERLALTLVILCADPESADQEYVAETQKILEHFEQKISDLPQVFIQYRKLFNWVGSINRISDGGAYRRPVPCEQPFYLLMVHSDGDVSMCCADTMKELIVGDIRQVQSIKDILTSEPLRLKRNSLLDQSYRHTPACAGCEVYSAVDESLLGERERLLPLLNRRKKGNPHG
jgi:radical SAM protein with 4Fe4S-binding SPASM domain